MPNRAEQFTDNFKKSLEILWENKPKDMTFFIYVYARDINNRTDIEPDGQINTSAYSALTNYDQMWIRQNIDRNFNS